MKKKLLAIISATAAVGCAFAVDVKINPDKKFQTIEYFGASDAWATQYIGDFWSDAHREKIAKLLFSQKLDKYGNPEGAGLSLWRVNLGGGTFDGNASQIEPEWRAARSFLPENLETPDWSRCTGLRYFMEKARDYGCGKFMLFSNTPPIQWTLNGRGYATKGNPAANLKPEAFGKFANYMADAAKHFIEKGYNVEYISPINEPQCPWDYTGAKQEGSPWRCSDMKKILEELDRAIGERNIGTKIFFGETSHHVYNYGDKPFPKMPEHWENLSEEERPAFIIQKFFDKSGKFYIGGLKHLARQLASHSYHTHKNDGDMKAVRLKLRTEIESRGFDYHQSEWCMLGYLAKPKFVEGAEADWKPDNMTDIQISLLMARMIRSDFVDGNAKSWSYWVATEIKYGLCALVNTMPHSDTPRKGGAVEASKILWALGNYSFFVRPNFTRIGIDGADDAKAVSATAFLSPDGKRIVAVFVNMKDSGEPVSFVLPQKFANAKRSVYITDERRSLASENSAGGSADKISLYPHSITTVVFDAQ